MHLAKVMVQKNLLDAFCFKHTKVLQGWASEPPRAATSESSSYRLMISCLWLQLRDMFTGSYPYNK